ncbi:uncharacterized protein C8Q71DRAFT_697313 [Rhodofomes roseus]|uniref:Uncharacterized protein n=1 Tax=Rhodofomes roseus TaxID=34475 RepID=A0A4Y9Z212_9APHY|nr:uncharacterized protein C8Q71DRAFT_697313 [Rhodofomes roseus]KAH9843540.1 hypothetical protein C8Q71DRAFT_697313 [Rhodofomes roseus]TFY68876.1 hypothetical protein EVJ58_g745 [Rhodofomes roseus]
MADNLTSSDSNSTTLSEFDKGHAGHKGKLTEDYFQLSDEELAFYKQFTKIEDDAEMIQHIVRIQAEAYEVFPYPCIRWFDFVRLRITHIPAYERLLKLGREREGALYLDLGTCFGSAIRKPVLDGFPAKNCIASDLRKEFWDMGYQLYKDSPETFPVPFAQGDVLDPSFLKPLPPIDTPLDDPAPELSQLTSLTPLAGRLSAIHATFFFHLFSEEKQLQIAQSLAGLLSPLPGSMVFGSHVAYPTKGTIITRPTGAPVPMFCHSAESWEEMWNGTVFKKGSVKVEAELSTLPVPKGALDHEYWQLVWSVTRV